MVNRFYNFISDPDLGLISMFKTLLVNPAYLLSQIAVKDKIWFILQMTLPLFFLPFLKSGPELLGGETDTDGQAGEEQAQRQDARCVETGVQLQMKIETHPKKRRRQDQRQAQNNP